MDEEADNKPVPVSPGDATVPAPLAWLERRFSPAAVSAALGGVLGIVTFIAARLRLFLSASREISMSGLPVAVVRLAVIAWAVHLAAPLVRQKPRSWIFPFLAIGLTLLGTARYLSFSYLTVMIMYAASSSALLLGCAALARTLVGPAAAKKLPAHTSPSVARMILTGVAYLVIHVAWAMWHWARYYPPNLLELVFVSIFFTVLATAYPLEYSAPARERRLLEGKDS